MVLLVLFLVLFGGWSADIYSSAVSEYRQSINQCLKQAIDEELIIRQSSLENVHIWYTPYTDTSRFVIKTIRSEDFVFQVRVNKLDPTVVPRIHQYIFESFHPLNVNWLDSLLKCNMFKNSIPFEESYIEYRDLRKGIVISNNAPLEKIGRYLGFDVISLDIAHTVGVKAYVSVPFWTMVKPVMSRKKIWLAVFGLAVLISLFFLLHTGNQQLK